MDYAQHLATIPPEAFSPAAKRFVGPGVPEPPKMMAARGLAPLPPRDMCTVLAALAFDPIEAVAQAARKTIGALPERILEGALKDKLHPAVLHGLATEIAKEPRWVELILLNPATDDETVHFLASKTDERQLEIISQNEIRLIRAPHIIEALYLNPRTRMSTVDRLMEFAVRNGLDLSGIPAFKEAQAAILGIRDLPEEPEEEVEEAPATAPATAPQARAPIVPGAPGSPVSIVSPGDARAAPAPATPAAPPVSPVMLQPIDAPTDLAPDEVDALAEERPESETAANESEGPAKNVQALLIKMTASQRVRWAQIGNREVRSYLMRDSNKMVAAAAIKNPRVTEQEILTTATSRSVNDEVIRVISRSREWTRSYQVRLNLVNNPKCPLPMAMRFLRTLRSHDIKALSKSKNVSAALSTVARRMTANDKSQ
jgi:hypothetical protein